MRGGEAGSAARTAAEVLRLAFGDAPGEAPVTDWRRVLVAALTERCAPLAWRRSGDVIRGTAPRDVVVSWRHAAVQADARGRVQLELLLEAAAALDAAGAAPIVLKGLPLSASLYGDPFVRETADADLYVPGRARAAAARALLAIGWRQAGGEAPWEEAFTREVDGVIQYLDLHSSLLDHNLAHLDRTPVGFRTVRLDGRAVTAHHGSLVPAYLAAHAAKHRLPPLLWFVDLATLWQGLGEAARDEAWRAARRHRLSGYLEWGVRMADAARRAAAGELAALDALGYRADARHDGHPLLRDVRLAATPSDAARALAAWAWPPPLRRDPGAFAARCAARARSLFRRAPAATSRYELR